MTKEDIIQASLDLIKEKGFNNLNLYVLCSKMHISLNTIYQYFPSKKELTIALVDYLCKEIIRLTKIANPKDFISYVNSLFQAIKSIIKQYPDFLNIFIEDTKILSKNEIKQFLASIKARLYESLLTDDKIKDDLFNQNLSASDLIDFVFDNITTSIIKGNDHISILSHLLTTTLY